MPTPNLGLTKPNTGATGWGATVNANYDLIDAAMAGLSDSSIALDDAGGIVPISTGTTNGARLGVSAAEKVGFWGATPIARPAHADQAAVGAQTQQALTDSSGGTASTTLGAISDAATRDAIASLAARLAEVRADVAGLRTLANAVRAALVAAGLIKGSA